MKADCNGKNIIEFIILRVQMYSVKIDRVESEIEKLNVLNNV